MHVCIARKTLAIIRKGLVKRSISTSGVALNVAGESAPTELSLSESVRVIRIIKVM